MDWTEVNIYTSSEGVDPVCGCLLGVGITGFLILGILELPLQPEQT